MANGGTASARRLLGAAGTAAAFLRRLDSRNLRMLPRTLSILGRPAPADWWYNRDLAVRELPAAARNLVLSPAEMGRFQRHCPVAGYVSTPVDGILAGFTHRGRMSTLLYPHTGFTQQLTYFESGAPEPGGARPREGAFFGVETTAGRRWLWEADFGHDMRPGSDTGSVEIEYAGAGAPVEASETAYVLPGTGTVVRDLDVRNAGDDPVERVLYYMSANANALQQYPPGITSPNRAVAGDRRVRWTDRKSDVAIGLLAGPDSPVDPTGVADAPLDGALAAAGRAVTGRHLGGFLAFDAPLEPGDSTTVSVYTGGIAGETPAELDRPAGERQPGAGDWWDDSLADVPVGAVEDRFAAQYRRSVVGLLKLSDPASGSISAAPNVQPTDYPSWPRDGAFEQCYTSDGAPAGVILRENDQQGIFVHAVRAVYEATGDAGFVRETWPAVAAALDYTVAAVADNGLLQATPDFAEMPTHARQSLWTNTFAYRGLLDGAALADVVDGSGDLVDGTDARGTDSGAAADRYRAAAARVGDAVERTFFAGRDAFATALTVRGTERDPNPMFAAAVHPTGWAADHGRVEEVVDGCTAMHARGGRVWLPREFVHAASLYAAGRTGAGDEILDRLQGEHPPGGTLAEEVTGTGDHRFAALGWANAAFVHAVNVREGLAATVE